MNPRLADARSNRGEVPLLEDHRVLDTEGLLGWSLLRPSVENCQGL